MPLLVLIDDNLNDVQLMRRILERAGYEVLFATSGEQGLAMIRVSHPDCVMVDYRMPGMDGYEVCRQIKNDSSLQNIPVLMLTGADAASNVVAGLDAGADDFVTKSSDLEVILARVRALLRIKAYQDRMAEQAEQLRKLYEELSQTSEKIMALNQRFNKDLSIARRVQEALLPHPEFSVGNIEIRSAYIPSETLSGDFYDYFVESGALYLFMADVSGHGLPAAILVSLLKSYLHSEAGSSRSLSDFMARLNDFLATASLPSQYATAQILRLDHGASQLVYSNAAHPPFLLFKALDRQTHSFDMPGHLLGAMPEMTFDEHSVEVGPGDILFIYTDGLTDRRNQAGDFYALDRIAAILDSSGGANLPNVYQRIYEDIIGFGATEEFKDDIAFILTRFA